MKTISLLLIVLAVAAFAVPGSADILFSTGAPQQFFGGWHGWGSYYNTDQANNIFARPFSIIPQEASYLEEIRFWGVIGVPQHAIQLDLYNADGMGHPTTLKDSWFISAQDIANGALFHISEPSQPMNGGNLKVGWMLPSSVLLQPNQYYAMAIYGLGGPDEDPSPVYWTVNTPVTDQGPLSYVTSDGGGSWNQFDPGSVGLGDQFGRNALELVGTPIPEPTTLLLLSLGIAPMAGLLRRKRA